MCSRGWISILFSALLSVPVAAQNAPLFSISVAPPTSPKDVQVRYIFDGNLGMEQSSNVGKIDDTTLGIRTSGNQNVKTLKAILFAPNCELVTISVDDLAASDRKGEFQCRQLPTVPLQGRADISSFAGKDLQVEALYVCNWAGRFFGVPSISLSPFSVAKAHVETDGSFTVELPDFASDPSWSSLSHNAALVFYVDDAQTGQRLAQLTPAGIRSRSGAMKVAPGYPNEIQFAVRLQMASR